ncbi:MAG: hypothetical protein Q8M02_12595 [Candidatus Didemnitutus sp.]|nr:hypothetical protein [Candidatus Didemnitutus sp.]
MRILLSSLALACTLTGGANAYTMETSSPKVQQALRDRLPKFNPAASAAPKNAANKVERPAEQEGVTTLPDYQVVEKKVIQPDADDWLTKEGKSRKAIRLAESKMNALDLALNRWHIPLLTPSFDQRAQADYEREKNAEETKRLERIANFGKKTGPP